MYRTSENDESNDSIKSHGGGDGVAKTHGGGDGMTISASKISRNVRAIPIAKNNNAWITRQAKTPTRQRFELNKEKSKTFLKGCIRSASVAEITPSKSATKKIKRYNAASNTPNAVPVSTSTVATLYTPRPLDELKPAAIKCPIERFSCAIYRQLMLLAWRKTKKSYQETIQQLAEKIDLIAQMDRQNRVLNDLRKAEEAKRTEASIENQKHRKIIEALEFANNNLTDENKNLKDTVDNFEYTLAIATENISTLNEKAKTVQEALKKKTGEIEVLKDQIVLNEKEVYSQKVIVSYMQDKIRILERHLKDTESNLKFKSEKYTFLKEESITLLEEVSSLLDRVNEKENEINKIKNANQNLENKIRELENTRLKNIEKFAKFSIPKMHHIAVILLPIYYEYYMITPIS